MKILYDHQIFMQSYGGISRYHYELLKLLPLTSDFDVELSLVFSNNEYINSDIEFKSWSIESLFGIKAFKGRDVLFKAINKILSKRKIRENDYDILHPTYYDTYCLKGLKKPLVITVHDFVHDRFTPQKRDVILKKEMIARADKVIAISQSTKNDILEFNPNIDQGKVEVIYHGHRSPNISKLLNSIPNISSPFILFVGKRNGYKNFNLFVEAVQPLLSQSNNLQLICTGHPFDREETQLLKNLKITNVVNTISASDSTLQWLYQNALLFVFPSLYEGFGLPILEAFSNGCPVASSVATSLPEIGGSAAVYFDPKDKDSIFNAISNLVNSEYLRKQLQAKGRERVKEFTWDNSIQKTSTLYRSLR